MHREWPFLFVIEPGGPFGRRPTNLWPYPRLQLKLDEEDVVVLLVNVVGVAVAGLAHTLLKSCFKNIDRLSPKGQCSLVANNDARVFELEGDSHPVPPVNRKEVCTLQCGFTGLGFAVQRYPWLLAVKALDQQPLARNGLHTCLPMPLHVIEADLCPGHISPGIQGNAGDRECHILQVFPGLHAAVSSDDLLQKRLSPCVLSPGGAREYYQRHSNGEHPSNCCLPC